MNFPHSLLTGVYWAFSGHPYPSEDAFSQAVHAYNHKFSSQPRWYPEQHILPTPSVAVRYHCWRQEREVEPWIQLDSANEHFFSAANLLFLLHNAVVEDLRNMDHQFFEGLGLLLDDEDGHVPRYQLFLGS